MTGACRTDVLRAGPARAPSPALADAADVLRVLGDATRLQMMALLAAETEPLCVCHLEAHFALGQPTISHHLRVLRDAGLVTSERRGTWMYYALATERIARVAGLTELLGSLTPKARKRGKACCP